MLHDDIHRLLLGVKKRPMRWMCYQLGIDAHDVFFRSAEFFEDIWHWQIQGGLMGEYRGFKHQENLTDER